MSTRKSLFRPPPGERACEFFLPLLSLDLFLIFVDFFFNFVVFGLFSLRATRDEPHDSAISRALSWARQPSGPNYFNETERENAFRCSAQINTSGGTYVGTLTRSFKLCTPARGRLRERVCRSPARSPRQVGNGGEETRRECVRNIWPCGSQGSQTVAS